MLLCKQRMRKVNGSPFIQTMTKQRTTWPRTQHETIRSENNVLDFFPSNDLFPIVSVEVITY
jgi:hypothetical protein